MVPPPLEAEHAESSYLATVRPQASVVTHLQHDFGFFNYFRAVCRFFYNHDLWSWIVAKVHHSIASVMIHLLHNFKFSAFLWQQVQLQPPEVLIAFSSVILAGKFAP